MQLQHLRYLVALARHRHFAKAASECGVSQPTLSAGLVTLEQELGRRLIERDRRFIGLTVHGEAILPWAEQALGAVRGLNQAAAASAQSVTGEFRLAAIPSALPLAGPLGGALLSANPGLTMAVQTGTWRQIEHDLQANECDAGLTYLDHEPPRNALAVELHREQYLFAARADGSLAFRNAISWEEAAEAPLCLLHQGMQYRRILDTRFAELGLSIAPRAVADGHVALLALVRSANFATILPDSYASLLAGLEWCRFVPIEPEAEKRRIGLVVVNKDPLGTMARLGLLAARQLELHSGVALIDELY